MTTPPVLMTGAALAFSLMGVCVKLASATYGAGEIVVARAIVGLAVMAAVMRWRRISPATTVPAMHLWRSLSGTTGLVLWFYAMGGLPLATATTLNYMSSVWIALFLIGGAALTRPAREAIDGRLVVAVLTGFAGVALVLRPTMTADQAWYGLAGLLSGVLGAMAYLQVSALGRAGEPEERVVFYFSATGVVAGLAVALATEGPAALAGRAHTPAGLALLVATGLFATAGQWCITRAYGQGGTLGTAALQYLGIAFSFVFGVWIFGDPVTWLAIGGMILIVAAGLIATLVRSRSVPAVPRDPGPTQT